MQKQPLILKLCLILQVPEGWSIKQSFVQKQVSLYLLSPLEVTYDQLACMPLKLKLFFEWHFQ